MTERALQNVVSVFLILAHFLILLLVFVLYLMGGFDPPDVETALSIIVPMVGALSALALGHVIEVKKKTAISAPSERLTGVYVFTALLLPSLFVLATAAVLVLKAYHWGLSSDGQFKSSLAGVETIFGAYTGKVLGS
jgi:hypothetical protein